MAGQTSIENGKKGGRPKGKKTPKSLERDRVMAAYRLRVLRFASSLLNSQLTLAMGVSYLLKIEKKLVVDPKGTKTYRTKKPERVTDPEEIFEYFVNLSENNGTYNPKDSSAIYYYITTKDPNIKAIESLLNRAFGKPGPMIDPEPSEYGEIYKIFNEPQVPIITTRVVANHNSLN